MKECTKCKETKDDSEFRRRSDSGKLTSWCKKCTTEYDRNYRAENLEHLKILKQIYYDQNKEAIQEYKKEYYEENIEEIQVYKKVYYAEHKEEDNARCKEYRKNNIEAMRAYKREWQKEKRATDPSFALRLDFSIAVGKALKLANSSKKGDSCMDYLSWTIEEFWEDFEKKFALPENLTPDGKIWMTRENRGKYIAKDWIDNDPSTWKWQVDHITPHSDLPYSSMKDNNFKKCWDLENLRPLNAKQNMLDGSTGIRHTKKRNKRRKINKEATNV